MEDAVPYGTGDHQGDVGSPALFVPQGEATQGFRVQIGFSGKLVLTEQGQNFIPGFCRTNAEGGSGAGHHGQSDADASPMGQGKAASGFHGMPQGVAQVQELPGSGVPLVSLHQRSLGGHAVGDDRLDMAADAAAHQMGEGLARQDGVLDHLAAPGLKYGRRQGREGVGVAQHQPGGMEGPGQILSGGQVDGGFPPTELSTMAKSVVGTWRYGTPRRYVAAAKPVRSPVTPPPKATSRSSRVI